MDKATENQIQRDLQRQVYCVLGIPIDAITLLDTRKFVTNAAVNDTQCFLSTPNLNFFVQTLGSYEFTQSLLESDLCVADGQPLCWIARFLDIPIVERVAGSTLFESLLLAETNNPLRVFFFGGQGKVAEQAMHVLNKSTSGLVGVGALNPGMGTVEDMSSQTIINSINAAKPDFLVVALGAKKGQEWILSNKGRLNSAVVSHLGAVVNFTTGNVKRAPEGYQKYGMEWLWRIKEEPSLWSRYWKDGTSLIRVFFRELIPYKLYLSKLKRSHQPHKKLNIKFETNSSSTTIICSGALYKPQVDKYRTDFINVICDENENVYLDLENVSYLDSGSLGLFLLLEKHLKTRLKISKASVEAKRILTFNRMLRLLNSDSKTQQI